MKIIMTKASLLFVFVFLSFQVWSIDIQVRQDKKTGIAVGENTVYHFQAVNKVSSFKTITVATPLGNFTDLIIPEFSFTSQAGSPKLPVSANLIEVPFNADIQVNIIDYSFVDYNLDDLNLFPILPAQPPLRKSGNADSPFSYDSLAYSSNSFYPSAFAEATVVGISRGLRLGRLQVNAVQYNPVTHVLRVYSEIKLDVVFLHPDIQLTLNEKKKNESPFFRGINMQILNHQQELDAPLDTIIQYPVKYVIVSAAAFQSALQPFVAWKKKKGFTVVEAYTDNAAVGSTTTSIKNYLQGLYTSGTPSNPAPSFVLFVGDVAQLPTFAGSLGTHPSDLYYCEYTGDHLPEMYYGRFSANSVAQLQPQIDKTLEYEQYLMPDPSFLGNDVMIAGSDPTYGPSHANPQITYGTSTYFNLAHNLTSHTYLYPNSGSQAVQIRLDVNSGCCFANYTAHGSETGWADPSFQTTDVPAMTNAHKYPLMVGNACLTNKFDYTECFGEALLRAANKGAIGYIGASDYTYWDEDFYWSCGAKPIVANPTYSASTLGAFDRTFHDHGEAYSKWFTTQGQMVYAGNLAVVQGSPSSADYYWEIYHLMGDPSLSIYYSVPPQLSVTYNSILPPGTTSFTVNTEPYAYCALSASGVLHGAKQANASGLAVIPITAFSSPITADVVVTKQNFQPFIGTVSVSTPNTPVIVYQSNSISDPAGNNNNKMDPGETVSLTINLQNIGSMQANLLLGTLTSASSYITINTNNISFGSIAGGSSGFASFSVSISPSAPQGHIADFTISINGSNGITATASFSHMVGQIPVLIINWDGNNTAASSIQTAIEANSVNCQVVTSLPASLTSYSALFVCLGVYSNNHILSAAEGSAIAAFINSGGRAYIEGGDTWFYDTPTTAHPLFKITAESDGSSDLSTLNGQSSSLTQGQSFAYSGDNNWIDHIVPQSGSTAFTIFNNLNPAYGTGVAYNGTTYKTIGVSHEFAGLTNGTFPSTRNELMHRYLDFFGLLPTDLVSNFTVNNTIGCTGNTLNFTDLSTGNPTFWSWSFPGGSPSTSTLQNPTVTYNIAGTYNVTLTVTNSSGSNSLTKSNYITINAPPVITLQPVNASAVEYSNASFTLVAQNATTYQWQYSSNNGTTWNNLSNSGGYSGTTTASLLITAVVPTLNNYKYRCLVSGTCLPAQTSFAATLTVTPLPTILCTAGNFTGCSGSVSVPVNVTNFNAVAAVSLTMIINGSLHTYSGVSNVNPALLNGSLLVNQSGNILVVSWFSLSVASLGNGTLFNLNFNGNFVGAGTINWDSQTPGNCQFSGFSGNVIPATYVNGSVTVSGMSTPVSVSIAAEPSSPVCAGIPVSFMAAATNGGSSPVFQWRLNGTAVGTGDSWSSSTLQNGDVINCRLTSSLGGCTLNNPAFSNSLTAVIHPKPTPNLGNDTLLPAGSTVILNAGAGSLYYNWSTGATTQTITVTNTGTYSVTATTQYGCSASDTVHITIGITSISGTVYYDNSFLTPIAAATVNLKQGNTVMVSTTTNAAGQYSFNEAPIGTFTLNPSSTIAWGGVNATDGLLILKHFVGITHLTGIRLTAADVDNSTAINSIDALATQKRFTNMITAFAAGDWAFEKPSITVNGLAAQVVNIRSLCYGDVNGSYIPSVRTDYTFPVQHSGTIETAAFKTINYPIYLSEPMLLGAISLIADIPEYLQIIDVKGPDGSLEDVVWNYTNGKLFLSWYSLENISQTPDKALFTLKMQVNTSETELLTSFSPEIIGELASPEATILSPSTLLMPALSFPSEEFNLSPNPFNTNTTLTFSLIENSSVIVSILSLDGRQIRKIADAAYTKGNHSISFDGHQLAEGLFLLKIETGNKTQYLKFIKTR